jgi:hypothetical protein
LPSLASSKKKKCPHRASLWVYPPCAAECEVYVGPVVVIIKQERDWCYVAFPFFFSCRFSHLTDKKTPKRAEMALNGSFGTRTGPGCYLVARYVPVFEPFGSRQLKACAFGQIGGLRGEFTYEIHQKLGGGGGKFCRCWACSSLHATGLLEFSLRLTHQDDPGNGA